MRTVVRLLLPSVVSLSVSSEIASSQVSMPLSSVPECITLSVGPPYPGNSIGTFRVEVRDVASMPVPGATVSVTFSPGADAMIAWCVGQVHPVVTTFSDVAGNADFVFEGGGCIADPVGQACAFAPGVATVSVTGPAGIGGAFVVNIFCLTSPDVLHGTTGPAACPDKTTCDGATGSSRVGLTDTVFHTRSVKLGLAEPCSKFSPPFSDPVNLFDGVMLTQYLKNGVFCDCQ